MARQTTGQTVEVTTDESMPSTSPDLTLCEFPDKFPTVHDLRTQLEHEVFNPWMVETTADNEGMKFQLHDVHSIAKYTVLINRSIEFTVHVFNWPIPDNHAIYNDRKRRVRRLEDCKQLLNLIENSMMRLLNQLLLIQRLILTCLTSLHQQLFGIQSQSQFPPAISNTV